MRKIALCIIDFYRKYLSKLKLRPRCRFYPSCSNYAYEAIAERGFFVGTLLGILRILRCNPFFRGGVDFVPKKPPKIVPKTRTNRTRVPKKPFYRTDIFQLEYRFMIKYSKADN